MCPLKNLLVILAELKGLPVEHYFSHWLSFTGTENQFFLELEEDTPQNREILETSIKEGYWVYSYITCMDELEFKWFESLKEAKIYYKSISLNAQKGLVVEKKLLKVGVEG